MAAMTGFACALEPHLIKEIDEAMEYLNFARSERYRNLIILGLDEYAISGSELRKKRFPIKEKIVKCFTVMLPDAINKEIESVQKKRKQIKKLIIRYIVLLGFEKWKRDQENIKCQKVETPGQDEKVEPKIEAAQESFKPWQRKLAEDKPGRCFIADKEVPIYQKFQAVIDLVRELDLKITIEKK